MNKYFDLREIIGFQLATDKVIIGDLLGINWSLFGHQLAADIFVSK